MKQSYLISVVMAASFNFLASCSKEDETQSVDFTSLSIADVCEGSVLKTATEKDKTIIITSEKMLTKETGCLASSPQVDFETHFVLAGRVAFDNCAELERETILVIDNVLKYQVQINQFDCQKIDTVYFMAAVPIRYRDHQIDFDITY